MLYRVLPLLAVLTLVCLVGAPCRSRKCRFDFFGAENRRGSVTW